MRFRSTALLLLSLVLVASAVYLRRWPRPADGVIEQEAAVVPPMPESPSPLPPPTRAAAPARPEVQATLDRLFARAVAIDQATAPAFVPGDFNGDDITDLAVAVRPRSEDAAARLNAEHANWGRQDAAAPASEAMDPLAPVKVGARDLLLAVVHGVGAHAWRSTEAGPCYLVKNAVGSGLRLRPLAGVPPAVRMKVIRPHTGDVMLGDRGGQPGIVFWTGAAYAWAVR